MSTVQNDFHTAAKWLEDVDAVLITASNGLSIAEGYHIFADNQPFQNYFWYFRKKYGVDCLIRGVFTPMTEQDHQDYMKAVHQYLIDDYKPSRVMADLKELVQDKDWFIVTSNGDTHFQLCGFDPEGIFEAEGNFDGLEEGSGQWNAQRERFTSFVKKNAEKKTVLFELGIGSRNQLIKQPTMDLASQCRTWRYITMNMPGEIRIPSALSERSIALMGDIGVNFRKMLERNEKISAGKE